MAELIFEIFSEEFPARMQLGAAAQLKEVFQKKMEENSLFFSSCKTFVTPRRLTLYAEGMSLTQEDSVTERRGPRTDAAPAAIEGFLASSGLKREQLTIKATPKGDFYFAIIRQKGRNTTEILQDILNDIIANFSWPKSMRWGEGKSRWVRPIKNIACLFGGEVLPISFEDIKSNNTSYGHRFLAPDAFTFKDFNSYKNELKKRFVILDNVERKKLIEEKISILAKDNGTEIIADEKLLDEVTGLVEWPVAMIGSINNEFMNLPAEVLITSMRSHQKYFCLRSKNVKAENIAPYFVFISNIDAGKDNIGIVSGNQRVLKARLSDAKFFYAQDKSHGLESFSKKLNDIVFHASVGTMAERVQRIEKIAVEISSYIAQDSKQKVARAAKLSKCDLASEMVGEFPELQGLMGYYYALEQKEDLEVALAIKNQYSPAGASDVVPNKSVSICVALAEKIDALCSLFAAGERATGSKDPYALRRAALGIIRIINENKILISLESIIKKALKLVPSSCFKDKSRDEIYEEIYNFILERLKHQLKAEGFAPEAIDATISNDSELNIYAIKYCANVIAEFVSTKSGAEAIEAYKRASNILRAEEKKHNVKFAPKPSSSLLEESAEKILVEEFEDIKSKLKALEKSGDFEKSLLTLTKLTKFINAFYDNTQINCDDKKLRENRYKISAAIVEIFNKVADFTKI